MSRRWFCVTMVSLLFVLVAITALCFVPVIKVHTRLDNIVRIRHHESRAYLFVVSTAQGPVPYLFSSVATDALPMIMVDIPQGEAMWVEWVTTKSLLGENHITEITIHVHPPFSVEGIMWIHGFFDGAPTPTMFRI